MGLFDLFKGKPKDYQKLNVDLTTKASKNAPRVVRDYQSGSGNLASPNEEATYRTSDLITSCVEYIAGTASQTKVKFLERSSDNKYEAVKDKKLLEIEKTPNPFFSWEDIITLAFKSYLLGGNSYITLEKVKGKFEIWNLTPPSKVAVVPNARNYIDGFIYDNETAYKASEVCHWKNHTINNQFYGQSYIASLIDQLVVEGYSTEELKSFYENSAVGQGIITSELPLTTRRVEDIREQFKLLYGQGKRERRGTMILPNGLKYETISLSPKDSMLLDTLDITEHRVLQLFHLNSMVLGGAKITTFRETKEAQQVAFNTAVRPLLISLEATLTNFFRIQFKKPELIVKFDFDRIPELSDSLADKTNSAKALWSTGIMSLNEARDLVGLPSLPIENANKHFLPSYLLGSEAMTIEDWTGESLAPTNQQPSPQGSTNTDGGSPDGTSR